MLSAVAEHLEIESDLIPGIATGFCGGIARTCGQCGAVSGAILAIGLTKGRMLAEESPEPCYRATRELLAGFEARFGSTNCRVLTGCDLGTEQGQRDFHAGDQRTRCRDYTAEATRIALELLD